MKVLSTLVIVILTSGVFAQIVGPVSNACNIAQSLCNSSPTVFPYSTGPSPSPVVPPSGSISNPSTNPAGVNAGCLYSGELNPNWFILNVASNGLLEFQIGAAGGSGYYDWALWPYNPATACSAIASNTLPPAACNWNASSQGFTGMSTGGPPPGGISGNFQPSIPVTAGEQYILMFSNYSGFTSGTVQLSFPPTGAAISCQAGTPDQTICLGDTATVDIVIPPGLTGVITYDWWTTTNVSDPTAGTGVLVNPPVTTDYFVEIFEDGIPFDTVEFTITVVTPPTPDAGTDDIVCIGTPISLNGTISDPTNTFVWTYDASAVSPPPFVSYSPSSLVLNPNVTVNQPGVYQFILTEDNPTCGPVADTVQIEMVTISLTATAIPPSCQGMSDGQIHITSANAVEYSFDNGATWVPDSFNVTLPAGAYTVCARSIYGCQACTTINVVDPAPVTITVSNDTTICQNGTANMWATATGGVSYDFHWDHTSSVLPNQSVNPTSTTVYTVYAENELGCISPNETITVTVLPPLSGSTSPNDTVCPTYSTNITANVTGGLGAPYTYVWSTGDTYTGGTSHTITVTPTQTTTYTVTITDDCESTPLVMQVTVRVAPLPVPDYVVLDPDQCEPAIFHVVNTTDPTMSQYVYWLVDGEYEYVNQDTIVTPAFYEGEYNIQMIVTSYEGCVDSITFIDALVVKPRPKADFKYSPNPITMFNTGDIAFIDHSFLGNTYEWWFESGYPDHSTLQNPHVAFPDGVTGQYEVTLVTTSELGCTDTITQIVTVHPEVLIYAPNAFTPDGDEFNQGWRVYMEGIDVYDFDLTVYDRWGEIVWESHDITVEWDGTYNGKRLPTGAYTWVIHTKDVLNDNKYTYNGHVTILK